MEIAFDLDGKKFSATKNHEGLRVNDQLIDYSIEKIAENRILIFINNQTIPAELVRKSGKNLVLKVNQKEIEISSKTHMDQLLEKLGMDMTSEAVIGELEAPMPGTILEIKVKEGQEVKKGEPLLILEAMKMENIIKAPADAVVSGIFVTEGQNVNKGERIIKF